MKAIILAGGYATRLRPISYAMPKHLFPVAGKPVLNWLIEHLHAQGVDEVTLAVNYMAEELRRRVGDQLDGVRIAYSLEHSPLGTAGPLKLAEERLRGASTFLTVNGDIMANIPVTEMLEFHRSRQAKTTIALQQVKDPSRFGVVKLNVRMGIEDFVEKPKKSKAPSRLINAGTYIMEPEVLDYIPIGRRVSLEREVFPRLAKEGSLYGFQHRGEWFDIGDIKDYRTANFHYLRKLYGNAAKVSRGAKVSGSARLRLSTLVCEGAEVDSRAIVGPDTVVGSNSEIGEGAIVTKSIIFDKVTIGTGTKVTEAIVGEGAMLGNRVKVSAGAVISNQSVIFDGVRIGRGAIIHPHKEVKRNVPAKGHVM